MNGAGLGDVRRTHPWLHAGALAAPRLPAVRALRAAGFGGPILVTGGHAGAGARAEALAAGADGFVEKPTSGAQLHEALLRAGLRRALPAG